MRTSLFRMLMLFLVLASCNRTPSPSPQADSPPTGKLKAVATTTILGDVVSQVAGDSIELSTLLPVGSDPHTYEPTPQDIVSVAEADIVFTTGTSLETFIDPLLSNAGGKAVVVRASEGINLLHAPVGEDQGNDPHIWFDPNNLMIWADNIQNGLSRVDPANAGAYQINADHYKRKLSDLDNWVRQQVAQIPEVDRKLVTDHLIFAYFASRYGFEQVGAVVPSYSTMAEPSAQQLATLEDAIRSLGVKAVFVGNTVNPTLAKRVAEDTGIQLVYVYTDSLTEAGGPAANTLDLIRYTVNAIVSGLRQS